MSSSGAAHAHGVVAIPADQRLSISSTALVMLGRYRWAAISGVMAERKKTLLRLPNPGRMPWIGRAMPMIPGSTSSTLDAKPAFLVRETIWSMRLGFLAIAASSGTKVAVI